MKAVRLRIAVAAVCSLSLALAACGSDDSGSDATTAPAASTAAPAATTAAPAATDVATTAPPAADATTGDAAAMAASVDIADFKFGPDEIHVAVGGTVTWNNTDDQQHTATGSGVFDTGAIAPGSSASFTFDEAGEVSYICSFHPFMKGTVVVG
jgi:plastocyanin